MGHRRAALGRLWQIARDPWKARALPPLLAYRLQLQRRRWRYTRSGGQTIRLWTGSPELVAATAKRGLVVVEPLEPRGLLEGLPGRPARARRSHDHRQRAARRDRARRRIVGRAAEPRPARGCRRREARAALGGRARELGRGHRASQRGRAQPGGLPAARGGARLRRLALRGRAPARHRLRHATVERDVRPARIRARRHRPRADAPRPGERRRDQRRLPRAARRRVRRHDPPDRGARASRAPGRRAGRVPAAVAPRRAPDRHDAVQLAAARGAARLLPLLAPRAAPRRGGGRPRGRRAAGPLRRLDDARAALLVRLQRYRPRAAPVVDALSVAAQRLAFEWERWDRQEALSWNHLLVARRP